VPFVRIIARRAALDRELSRSDPQFEAFASTISAVHGAFTAYAHRTPES
jgi:hypothetical protein